MHNITLDTACLCRQTGGRFRVNKKISMFKKLGVGSKGTAPNATVSKLNHLNLAF